MDSYRSQQYDHDRMNTTGICSQKSGALPTRCWLGDQQLVRLDYFCCRTVPFLLFDGITLSRNTTTDLIATKEEATTNIDRNGTIATKKRVILKKSRCGAKLKFAGAAALTKKE
jgi:hypothetical protein